MEFKPAKMLSKLRKKIKDGNEEKSLIKNIEQTAGERTLENLGSSGPAALPDLITVDVKVSEERVISIVRNTLDKQSTLEEFETPADLVTRWTKLISVLPDHNYRQKIDEFVDCHFPKLPVEGPPGSQLKQLQVFLESTKCMMFNEVLKLTSVLEEVGLLDPLIDSCNRHLFTKLDLLLNRDLSVKEIFCILMWGKDVFFSPDLQHVFRVSDPLLLTGFIERATEDLLRKLQNEISRTLQNILHYDQKHGHHEDSIDEESFIRVHIDVTQCLNAAIQSSKEFSQTLMCTVQNICLQELHHFVQKYVDTEKKCIEKLKPPHRNSLHLLRVISTCRQLRFFTSQLSNPELSNITCMLNQMEDHVLSILQMMVKQRAQNSLRHYFKKGDEHIHTLIEEIQYHCASLPQTDVGNEIQEIFVNVAFDCVSRVYLECLMKSKLKHLVKRWRNVGEKMREDALNLQNTFSEVYGNDDQKKLLQRMSEVLRCSDVEALKITFGQLYKDLPKDSEQYVPGLLHWRGDLSEREVKDVLNVIQDLDPNPKQVTCLPLKGLCCCLYYE